MSKWFIFLSLILNFVAPSVVAQNPYVHNYTARDGLPSNTVYYIYQDSKKFIWFATDAGVSRFDGSTFTTYTTRDGLSSNDVIFIKEDFEERTWLFHVNGSLSYVWHNKIFSEKNTPFLRTLEGKEFYFEFFQDKDSTIYFYNRGCEILALDKSNHIRRYNIHEKLLRNLPQEMAKTYGIYLRQITKSATGEFLIWTGHGIFRIKTFLDQPTFLSQKTRGLKVYPLGPDTFLVDSYFEKLYKFHDTQLVDSVVLPFYSELHLTSVLPDKDDRIWFAGFLKGVYCMQGNTMLCSLNIHRPQSLLRDHEGNVWMGSMNDGVYKVSPYFISHRHYADSLFEQKGIIDMCPDSSGGVWVTNGIKVSLLKNGSLYDLSSGFGNHYFNFLTQPKKGTLFIGERGVSMSLMDGIVFDNNRKRLKYKRLEKLLYGFKDIAFEQHGNGISAFSGGDLYISDKDRLFKDLKGVNVGQRIYSFFYDPDDNLVLNGRKLLVYGINGCMPVLNMARFDNKIITSHLVIGPSEELFVVEGDSTYLYKNKVFYNLSQAFDSPIDLKVKKVVYHEPKLYISSTSNIYSCDNLRAVIVGKKAKLRLLDIDFKNIHDLHVINDSLYVASDDGLTVIPVALTEKITTRTPIPYIRTIFVNDQETEPYCREVQSRGITKIAFSFGSINYSSTPVLYAYKLESIDTGWTTSTSGSVVYQHLPSGEYKFKLKMGKPTAEWSEEITIPIIIKASFWRHPLFIASLVILLLTGLIYAIVRRKNIQIKRWEIDHQLILLEQKALQSMMNPHFIFNSLGSIQNYLLQKKSGEAGLYLSQFARLIRQNMNAINAAMINLEEEVDRLKNYLDLERLRMEDKFEYHIEVDENLEAEDILIPSMIIQPFVENSIWHGISPMEGNGFIGVYFSMQDEHSMKVTIEDNGIGIRQASAFKQDGEKHLHLGMEMTRKRLELLGRKFDVKTLVEFAEAFPGKENPGTRVILVIPLSYPGTQ